MSTNRLSENGKWTVLLVEAGPDEPEIFDVPAAYALLQLSPRNNDTTRAYGVQFRIDGISYKAVAKREVILSAGVLQSPQLLMLSGVGPKDHLDAVKTVHHAPGVGENLQDHVAMGGMTYFVDPLANYTGKDPFTLNLFESATVKDVEEFAVERRGKLYALPIAEAMAFINTKYLIIVTNKYLCWRIFTFSDGDWEIGFPLLLRPRNRGYVKLRSSNVYQHPIIVPNYFQDPHDLLVSSHLNPLRTKVFSSFYF
nr:uncharacterized GMC-type oxidoreductase Mb1310-like [Megalopta genalis]